MEIKEKSSEFKNVVKLQGKKEEENTSMFMRKAVIVVATKNKKKTRFSFSCCSSSSSASQKKLRSNQSRKTTTTITTATRRRTQRLLSSSSSGNTSSSSSSVESLAKELARHASQQPQQHSISSNAGRGGSFTTLAKRLSPETRERVLKELQISGTTSTRASSSTSTSTSSSASASASASASTAAAEIVPEPHYNDLKTVAITTAVPFVGFGFMDNAILIVAGDAIDTSLGVILGISTMCAAAIGNIISDVAGIMLGTAIEDFCAKYLKLPAPNLTSAQRQLRSVRFANQFGCAVGIVIGCIIGMFPLLYIDSNKIQVRKREAHLDSIFRDVITEAGSLIGAQIITMFLLVHEPEEGRSPVPTPDGKYLYAKYDADADLSRSSQKKHYLQSERYIPLGRGIVSRAALTGTSWNIYDAQMEPDFSPDVVGRHSNSGNIRNMVCVPVLNGKGQTIAVLQAINKVGKGRIGGDTKDDKEETVKAGETAAQPEYRGFTTSDVQVLKALASHVGVALYDGEGDDMRLKDTITMLKDYGLEGLSSEDQSPNEGRKLLFPED